MGCHFSPKVKIYITVTFHVWIVIQTQVWVLSSVAVEKKSVTLWSNVLLPHSLILPNCLWYHKSLNLYIITLTLKLKDYVPSAHQDTFPVLHSVKTLKKKQEFIHQCFHKFIWPSCNMYSWLAIGAILVIKWLPTAWMTRIWGARLVVKCLAMWCMTRI